MQGTIIAIAILAAPIWPSLTVEEAKEALRYERQITGHDIPGHTVGRVPGQAPRYESRPNNNYDDFLYRFR